MSDNNTIDTPSSTATPTPTPAPQAAPANSVITRLKELGVSDDMATKICEELGAKEVADLVMLTVEDLTELGMKRLQARKLVEALQPTKPEPTVTPSPMAASNFDVLPGLPDDSTWLNSLKVGGVLKFNRDTVIGTVSAALASRIGLYDLPEKIIAAMDRHAQSVEEPVPPGFYEMQRMLTERSYAEIFAAIPGVSGRYATKARREALLGKLNENLWGSLISFHGVLSNWFDAWQKTMSNPAVMMGGLAAMMAGNPSTGMVQAPPTDSLRDAAEGVIAGINRIFSGTGTPVAMALAYDAQQIRKALEAADLPGHVGAANRDQMLRQLGVAVSSDYPRLEANLRRYTLGVIELPNVTAGQTEMAYINALYQLGCAIAWDQLRDGNSNGNRRPLGLGEPPRR